jgi:hypothetical protein
MLQHAREEIMQARTKVVFAMIASAAVGHRRPDAPLKDDARGQHTISRRTSLPRHLFSLGGQ